MQQQRFFRVVGMALAMTMPGLLRPAVYIINDTEYRIRFSALAKYKDASTQLVFNGVLPPRGMAVRDMVIKNKKELPLIRFACVNSSHNPNESRAYRPCVNIYDVQRDLWLYKSIDSLPYAQEYLMPNGVVYIFGGNGENGGQPGHIYAQVVTQEYFAGTLQKNMNSFREQKD